MALEAAGQLQCYYSVPCRRKKDWCKFRSGPFWLRLERDEHASLTIRVKVLGDLPPLICKERNYSRKKLLACALKKWLIFGGKEIQLLKCDKTSTVSKTVRW